MRFEAEFILSPCYHTKHLKQIHWSTIFCRMYGLVVMLTIPRSTTMVIRFKFKWDVETPIYITITSKLRFVNLFVAGSRVCAGLPTQAYSLRRKLEKFHYLYVISRQLWHCLQRTWQKQVVCPGRLVESGLFFIKRSWAI